MSDHTPTSPPRRYISRWLAAAVLLFSAELCEPLCAQEVPIIVSRETTYITEPLGSDGLPDYEQYLWNQQKNGVTPENNAAVLLWQVIWPGDLEPDQYAAMAKELGLKEVPTGENSLKSVPDENLLKRLSAWLRLHNKPLEEQGEPSDKEYSDQADQIVDRAMDHPWASAQIPPLAKWVEDNRAALDLAVEASRRPRYYSSSPSYLDGRRTMLIAILFPDVQGVRNVARALSIRAMQNMGEGRLDKAWDDVLAIHRLARLEGQQGTLVERMVAISIDQMACNGTRAVLGNHDLKEQLARRIQQGLAGLPEFSPVADILDCSERLSGLDAALQIRLDGPQGLSGEGSFGSPGDIRRFQSSIYWEIVLEDMNRYYDRLMQAAQVADREERARKLKEFEDGLKEDDVVMKSFAFRIAAKFSKTVRSQCLATALANLMLPATPSGLVAEDRCNTQIELTRLAAALAVYRAEHGAYPDSLDALVPDVLPELPVDVYHKQAFHYHRDGDGYLLYSAGPNLKDDGGSHEDWKVFAGRRLYDEAEDVQEKLQSEIPAGADDIAIRVPTPPFKLPAPEHLAPGQ